MRYKNHLSSWRALLFAAFVSAFNLFAQQDNWTGPTSGAEWNTAADWSLLLPPADGTNALIPGGTTVNYNVPMAADAFGVLLDNGIMDINTNGFNPTGITLLTNGGGNRFIVNSGGAVNVAGTFAISSNATARVNAGGSVITGTLLVGAGSTGG